MQRAVRTLRTAPVGAGHRAPLCHPDIALAAGLHRGGVSGVRNELGKLKVCHLPAHKSECGHFNLADHFVLVAPSIADLCGALRNIDQIQALGTRGGHMENKEKCNKQSVVNNLHCPVPRTAVIANRSLIS